MIDEVDKILKRLDDKQWNYDDTRLRAWAHTVHIGTHKSLDDPQDKPFFKTGKKVSKKPSSPSDIDVTSPARSITTTRMTVTTGISLGKRLDYRSQCLEVAWTSREGCRYTGNNYDEFAQTILKDMHT